MKSRLLKVSMYLMLLMVPLGLVFVDYAVINAVDRLDHNCAKIFLFQDALLRKQDSQIRSLENRIYILERLYKESLKARGLEMGQDDGLTVEQ